MASPIKFAHIVLKTSRFAEMLDWWKVFLEGEAHYWATCADDVGEILLGEQYLKRKTVSTRHIESKSKIVQRTRVEQNTLLSLTPAWKICLVSTNV